MRRVFYVAWIGWRDVDACGCQCEACGGGSKRAELHGYRMGTWITPCGKKCRKPGDPVVDEEGKPIRRQLVSVTLNDEWITCEACKAALSAPAGPFLTALVVRDAEARAEMQDEYDFAGGERGKYAARYATASRDAADMLSKLRELARRVDEVMAELAVARRIVGEARVLADWPATGAKVRELLAEYDALMASR